MDRPEVQRGIRESWAAVTDLELGETVTGFGPLPVNEEFRDLLFTDDVSYPELYIAGLELRHFNILLADFSFFQYSWSRLQHVRYAYYPNPFVPVQSRLADILGLREYVTEGLLSHEDFLTQLNQQLSSNRLAPIRYENAPSERKPFVHPCSHLHVGHGNVGRWPVAKQLTPLAFTLFVVKHHFPDVWKRLDDAECEEGSVFERRMREERAACQPVPENLFSAAEKLSFHFL